MQLALREPARPIRHSRDRAGSGLADTLLFTRSSRGSDVTQSAIESVKQPRRSHAGNRSSSGSGLPPSTTALPLDPESLESPLESSDGTDGIGRDPLNSATTLPCSS